MSATHPVRRPAPSVRPVPSLALLAALASVVGCADAVTHPVARPAEGVPAASIAAADAADPCGTAKDSLAKPGQARAVGDTVLCVAGGDAGADYALVLVNGSTNARRSVIVSVTPTGVVSPTAAVVSAEPAADIFRAAELGSGRGGALAVALEARRLASARALVRGHLASARRWEAARERRARLRGQREADVEPITVGQVLRLNTNTDDPCDSPTPTDARVVAVSKGAIVAADAGNPAGGFSDEEYQQIAVLFDSIVDPVDRKNFGEPTDLDENGRVILFFTRAVNALTPPNSRSYVGGFFWVRDLLPPEPGPDIPDDWVCQGSNAGEMFYLMVPDPAGEVNGNRFEKTQVADDAISTVGHEFQHLINASRRIYINEAATELEDVWLDEGLAHVAEELVFYARTGLASRTNVNAVGLHDTPGYLAAFNQDAIGNFVRLYRYLLAPSSNSPYADNDRIETRGATWSFLRFAADQRDGEESGTWYRLVNDGPVGMANLRNVFGEDLVGLFRNWSTSLLADDLTGADARFQQRSWDFPSVFHGVVDETNPYPLRMLAMAEGLVSTVRVTGGGAAYLRFGVEAGKTATLRWDALPAGMTLTLVRTR
jgi:hypothetical protein